jgi:tRNA dimethylallyltransferase
MLTGQSISSLQTKYADEPKERLEPLQASYLLLSFEPTDRAWLHANIERRFRQMLSEGFLQEVWPFYKNPNLHASLPSMRCVGYRQAWAFWQSMEEAMGFACQTMEPGLYCDMPIYEQFVKDSLTATRQLAKRQLTWLRSMKHRRVFACDAQDFETQVQEYLGLAIEQHPVYQLFKK